jgi:citrate synthase
VTAEAATWLSVEDAAQRLGVKPATLYAYVSRGILRRRRWPDGRSMFDAVEVEQLARRGRPRRPAGASELVIESRVTALGDDRPYYRGRDALALARRHHLEEVAAWLWTGDPAALEPREPDPGGAWRAEPDALVAGRAAQSALPADVLPLERLQVITPALAATDPVRHNVDPAAVMAVGRQLIGGMVDCLPDPLPHDRADGGTTLGGEAIANRLWRRLVADPTPPDPGLVDALRAALVLLADHELAASTFAARIAASVRADPYAVVSTALGAMGGALHGGASLGAEALLVEIGDPARAGHVIGLRLRRGERIPGFGHFVYRASDARTVAMLERLRAAAPHSERLAVAEAVLAEAERRRLPSANIDFALAVLASVSGMISGAGEAIFAIARTAGWLAHAMEEYASPTRLRPRAVYLGPPPPGG